MISRVLRTVREHRLFDAGDRVLLAVSGGPDSTALLHLLHRLAGRLKIGLHVACVDHGLRPESAHEAAAVRSACALLGLACDVLSVDVSKGRRAHGSAQDAARRVRLAALEDAADRRACSKIALGHTADDQAETVLFRILRGTGVAGLAGISYRRDRLVRPLLDTRRSEILAFLAKHELAFFSDPSNANRRYARSRIRHDILPALARENPRIVDALLALAHDATDRCVRSWRQAIPAGVYVPGRAVAVVDRILRDGQGTRRVAVRGGEVVIGYGKVRWQPMATDDRPTELARQCDSVTVEMAGCYGIPWSPGISVDIVPLAPSAHPASQVAVFDRARVRWPLVLRVRRPGDRMRPRGASGSRKLSDLLIDAKIPRDERDALPVLCDASGAILFVPGLRPSEVGRPVAGGTQDCFEVRMAR